MKKTDLSVILICILCGFIFTGCGKLKAIMDPKSQNAGDSHNNAVDDVSLQHKNEIDKTEDIPLTDSEKDDDLNNNKDADPDMSVADKDDSGEIVNLLSIGVSNMNETDTDKTLEFGDQSDPLKGLVADDILEIYRASYDVNNSKSVHDEAYALGSWIQDTIGNNINPDIRELGESIGRKYEFRFGTDISNNFDDNFPEIYGTYFALKDYYNSEGKNSSEIYDDISEENDLLGTGDPERIKEMYNDMQLFITSCNTYIRGR